MSENQQEKTELIKKWINEGHRVLSSDRWKQWDECVPAHINGIYGGAELKSCIEIIEILNTTGDFEQAKKVFINQNHSGWSYGIVVTMIKFFCDKGPAFVETL